MHKQSTGDARSPVRRSPSQAPLLVLFCFAFLACQVVTGVWRAPALNAPVPSLAPSAPPIPTARLDPAPAADPTEAAEPTDTPRPTPAPHHLAVFQELWDIVQEEYLYADFNGLDWGAVYDEVRIQVEAGLSAPDFYQTLEEMVAQLGDEHSYYLDPAAAAAEEAEFAGELTFVGIGVMAVPLPDRGGAMVFLTFPGSPAESAGISPWDTILAVDNEPILSRDRFLRDAIHGPEGTSVQLAVQTPGDPPRRVTAVLASIQGPIPVPFELLHTRAGLPVGYVMLPSFTDGGIPDQMEEALARLTDLAPLGGLIVDNRWNYGGADTVLRATLRFFTDGLVGHFANRDGRRPFQIPGQDIAGTQSLPLVVLIGGATASFGEVFAGVLQDVGRASLIGQATSGNVEILWGYDFDDGSRAWIAHDTFLPLNQPASAWETGGVEPDFAVPPALEPTSLEADPVIIAALDYLEGLAAPP